MDETDTTPRVLGVVPARGGSRGVLRKNLRLVGGTSLVAHAIEQAAASRRLDRTVISTDDEEIAAHARAAGGDVPFLRPAELARDETPTLPVLLHALEAAEREDGRVYEWVCCLQPTSPLRTSRDIDAAIDKALQTVPDSVVSVCLAVHPAKLKRMEGDRLVPYAEDEPEGARRQDLGPPAYRRNGAVYVFRRDVLLGGRLYGDDVRAVEMPRLRSIDVDDESDLTLANLVLDSLRRGDTAEGTTE